MQHTEKEPKVKTEELKREFEVLEDGTVIMTEISTNRVTFNFGQFRKFYMDHMHGIEDIDKRLSESFRAELEEKKADIQGWVDLIKPYLEEADEKTKAAYEKESARRKLELFKEYLEFDPKKEEEGFVVSDKGITKGKKSRPKKEFVYQVLGGLKDGEWERIITQAEQEDHAKLQTLKAKFVTWKKRSQK